MVLLIFSIFVLLGIIWVVREEKVFANLKNLGWQTYIITTLQSLVLSFQLGILSWSIFQNIPQQYSDFVTGNIGYANHNKSAEFYAIYTTIFAFVILFIAILILDNNYPESQEFRNGTNKIALYGLTPSFIMLGQSLRMSNTTYLLLISSGSIAMSLIVNIILRILYKKNLIKLEETNNIGIKLMLINVFLIMSELGIRIFLTRLGIAPYKHGILTIILVLIYIFLLIFKNQSTSIDYKLNVGIFISQLGVPFLLSILFAPPAKLLNGTTTIFSYKPLLLIIILSLVIISISDIYKRFIKEKKRNDLVLQIVSPWALVAILVFLQSNQIGWPGISPDEYHSSEFYLPWWLLDQFGYLPYLDYVPARGLVNYVPGLLAWLFFDFSLLRLENH